MTLFRAGNDEAFRVIHDRYRARLLGYARQMLASSPADPEDAVQEIFVRAYSHLRSNGRELALRAWLYRIAHNRCIDDLRRPTPSTTEAIDEVGAPSGADPHERVEQRDALRRLIVDVQRLPEQQRSALLMRELGGVTYADVADALGVSVPAVKSLLVRARLGLAQANEARDTACAQIREHVVTAHDRGVRASGLVRRHMRDCAECRRFRSEMRSTSRQLAALVPALGPVAAVAKLLGAGGGTAGGTGAQGAAVGTGAAVSTGTAVTTGATAGTGIIGGAAGTLVGAGHVATVIAAAVVTAGGAIGIQQISTPAPNHHAARPNAGVRPSRAHGSSAATDPSSAGVSLTAAVRSARSFSAEPLAASMHAVAQRRLAARSAHSRTAAAKHYLTHHAGGQLPLTTTEDPDHYVPPPTYIGGGTTSSSGSTTDPSVGCTTSAGASTCTSTDPCASTDTTGATNDTGSPAVSATESPIGAGGWSSCGTTPATPPATGGSTDPTTGTGSSSQTGSSTQSAPSTGTGSTTGTGTGTGTSVGSGTTSGSGTSVGSGTSSGTGTSSGSGMSSGSGAGTVANPATAPKTTDPFSNAGSSTTAAPNQGLSSTSSATSTPKAGGSMKSLKRGSAAAVYSSN